MAGKVSELIEAAHKQAQISGFWKTENVGEKFALIATEIMEYEDAVTDAQRLEEVADIVIRVFDLSGYLQLKIPEDVLENNLPAFTKIMYPSSDRLAKYFAHDAYRVIARATQRHRKSDLVGTRSWLIALVQNCEMAMYRADEHESPLLGAILAKMEKNAGRPHLHGSAY